MQNTAEALDVDDPGSRDLEARFETFFATEGRKLVGMAYLLTGDLAEAQDLAQEALVRVWERWDRVSGYEKPEAFARRVLHNLVIGRWRRRQSAPPDGPVRHTPAPDVDHLDVLDALAKLPVEQRSAIVMHDVVGLSASEIGDELGARPGTVRQWLSRGRSALAVSLERDAPRPGGK